ncbi:hypothetical protein [Kosmotoga pacifica]|uniref:DsrE family protein n=1 Tax=Kosmotoga pacifica TaxID=1330330 RepID=A0A0G2ZET6_9BACT|nr:hypothetical protein [Kosmotoga pacifica]AKI98059.1 hypothetical protein IX53_09720 [Kosmotoga pacifica]
MKKVVIILSTGEEEKLITGLMFAVNAIKYHWFEDVKIFLFGPAEMRVTKSERPRKLLKEIENLGGFATACKFLSDRNNISEYLIHIGLKVDYVGEPISELINNEYIPMVF